MIKCISCGCSNEADSNFCGGCGSPLPKLKECPKCGNKVKPDVNFCGKCGYNFRNPGANPMAAAGLTMGDKNVIAGDVVGNQENIDISGNLTIIKNSDETQKTVKCCICGHQIPKINSIECTGCNQTICENCFDSKRKICRKCADNEQKSHESAYCDALRHCLSDGIISFAERQELNTLQKKLSLDSARANELESMIKKEIIGRRDSEMTGFFKLKLEKAQNILYDEGKYDEAAVILKEIYEKYPQNELVLTTYLNALVKSDTAGAEKMISQNRIDAPGISLAQIDIDLIKGNLAAADEHLYIAEKLWEHHPMISCRRILCLKAMAQELNERSLLENAGKMLHSLPESKDKLERSFICKTRMLLLGQPPVTRKFCAENDLYYAVAVDDRIEAVETAKAAPAQNHSGYAFVPDSNNTDTVKICVKDKLYSAADNRVAGENPEALKKAAAEDQKAKRYEKAIKEFLKAAQFYANSNQKSKAASCSNRAGVCAYDMKNYSKALACYQQANQYDPQNPWAWKNIAECFARGWGTAVDKNKAYEYYRIAAEKFAQQNNNTEAASCFNSAGVRVHEMKNYSKALACYQQASRHDPQNPWAYYNIGLCCLIGEGETANKVAARQYFLRAAEIFEQKNDCQNADKCRKKIQACQ